MDLLPLPQAVYSSAKGEAKAEYVKKLHEKVKENLERKNEKTRQYKNKGRKELTFEPGDWVWLHMRPDRFPTQQKSKLSPRGDGPFRVLEKINENAYKLELPGELNISPTFNVSDLAPFHADDTVLRTEPVQEGGDDEAIDIDRTEAAEEAITIPTLRRSPRTRSGERSVREDFTTAIGGLIMLLEHEELKGELLEREITRETPIGPIGPREATSGSLYDLAVRKPHQPAALTEEDPTEPLELEAPKTNEEISRNAYLKFTAQTAIFLPVLQGTRETAIFAISKDLEAPT